MLPLAQLARGLGHAVAGSDRSRDQGRTPAKFEWLTQNGFDLFPQDGSGIASADQILIASAAIEDTVPEVARAKALGCDRMSRAQLLSALFNEAGTSIGIAGTSGKSTVTAMIAWILAEAGHDPSVMNGAVMKNFASTANPFASARTGSGDVFVSEVDESDGSIALYRPTIGVLLNVSLDHKSLEELRALFGNFLSSTKAAVVNFDNKEARQLAARAGHVTSYALDHQGADITADPASIIEEPLAISASLRDNRCGTELELRLPMPGRHNLSNALGAIAAATSAGIAVEEAAKALGQFKGLARRFDLVGTSERGIAVIDDFGHNPEKCAATLRTLKTHPGRVLAFFQPHGYGPLRQMGRELAETFASELGSDDKVLMCDPVYYGGSVDRSEGSERIVALINQHAGPREDLGEHFPTREACADRLIELAAPGDRIVIMGARDDTLSRFAADILGRLG